MTNIFFEIGVLIIVATFLSYLTKYLKQPLIPGYVLAGILLGPVLGIIKDTTAVLELAEIGIAFLLFVVGLELDFKKLKDIGIVASVGATIQIIILFLLGFFIGKGLGFGNIESIFIGMIVSFSSTLVVVKLLSDKSELDTLHGKIIIGFLLVEDFFAILALSSLNTISDFNILFLVIAISKTILLLLLSYFMNKFFFQPLFRFAAKTQELLFLISLSSCFFFAFLFQYFGTLLVHFFNLLGISLTVSFIAMIEPGFSIAMGAFIAGIGLASMPYTYEVIGKVRSLRDFFATLFFVSLGIQLTNSSLSFLLIPLLILLGLILVIKPIITFFITLLFGYTKKTSFETATSLAQTSEFSLIIVATGLLFGLVSNEFLSLAVMLVLVTMVTTSYGMKYNNFVYKKIQNILSFAEKISPKKKHLEYMPDKVKNEVLVVGFDRIGFNIFGTLKKLKKNFLIVDFNPEVIHKLIKEKIHCIYGDIGDEEIIERLNIEHAKIVISTIPDQENTKYLVLKTRSQNKKCTLIVTAYSVEEALNLYTLGADYVIMPHLLGGIHASLLLEEFHKDFSSLVKTKVKHIEELNKHIYLGHHKRIERWKSKR